MENWKLQGVIATIVGSVGGFVAMSFPEYEASLSIIIGFIIIFIILAWPEYEEVEHIYNPDLKQYPSDPWDRFKEALLKGGWKTKKVKRRKR